MPDAPVQLRQTLMPDVQPSSPPSATAGDFDRMLHSWQSRFTGGRSPSTVALAFMDWAAHTANAPFKTAALGRSAVEQWQRLGRTMMGGANSIAPQPGDHRFVHPAWQQRPYNLLAQSVLLGEALSR